MTDSTLVVPTDLKIEIEQLSRIEQRSEADVLRDAIQHYMALHDNGAESGTWARRPGPASDGIASGGRIQNDDAPPTLPSVFGSVSDGNVSSSNYEEWLKENWKPDW